MNGVGEKYLTTKDGRVCIPLTSFSRIQGEFLYQKKTESGWLFGESSGEHIIPLEKHEALELVEQLRLLNEKKK